MNLTDALFAAITNGKSPDDDLRKTVQALGGTKAVAQILGKSQRQVQRYVARDPRKRTTPPKEVADALRRTAYASPSVRRSLISKRRAARMRSRRKVVYVRGRVEAGPIVGGRDYKRVRVLDVPISGELMAQVLAAWQDGDDQGARDALEEAFGEEYVAGWEFGDVDNLDFDVW